MSSQEFEDLIKDMVLVVVPNTSVPITNLIKEKSQDQGFKFISFRKGICVTNAQIQTGKIKFNIKKTKKALLYLK